MIPPLMSSTLNGQDLQNLGNSGKNNQNNTQKSSEGQNKKTAAPVKEEKQSGRPEKSDD